MSDETIQQQIARLRCELIDDAPSVDGWDAVLGTFDGEAQSPKRVYRKLILYGVKLAYAGALDG